MSTSLTAIRATTMCFGQILKRLLDLSVSGLLLLALGPLILLVAALVRLKLGTPVFFCQTRPGLHGQPFKMIKFRSMIHALDGQGNVLPDAERITKLGRLLRSSSLDELPELWNVLRGDMSLVGPRPLLMRYLGRYSPEQARRHEVRPGITGWAQINGRNAISWDDKFKLDIWYVDNWSLWLDFRILVVTLFKTLRREGISAEAHVTMPEFMGNGEKEVGE